MSWRNWEYLRAAGVLRTVLRAARRFGSFTGRRAPDRRRGPHGCPDDRERKQREDRFEGRSFRIFHKQFLPNRSNYIHVSVTAPVIDVTGGPPLRQRAEFSTLRECNPARRLDVSRVALPEI
jgi:hypothetical protein